MAVLDVASAAAAAASVIPLYNITYNIYTAISDTVDLRTAAAFFESTSMSEAIHVGVVHTLIRNKNALALKRAKSYVATKWNLPYNDEDDDDDDETKEDEIYDEYKYM